MKAVTKITLLSLAVLCCLVVFGCGKEDGGSRPPTPDEATSDKSTAKIDDEAEKMNVEQLKAAAMKCKTALEAKTAEYDKKAQEIMKTLAGDKTEEKAKLKAEMAELSKTSEALSRQLEAYIAQIKAKGGDVSDLFPTE